MLAGIYHFVMKKMNLWLRQRPLPKRDFASAGIQELAFKYGKDRRRHPRVNFPRDFTFSSQPFFEYQGLRFDVIDLSRGGVCLFDPLDDLNIPMGGDGEIYWVSPEQKQKIILQVVGMSYQKKHLEFKVISPELSQEIESFLESGVWGQKMKRSVLSIHTHLESAVAELWVGAGGDNLSFYSDPHFIASLETESFHVNFFKGSIPVKSEKDAFPGQVLNVDERIQLLFFLSNLPVLSTRVVNLLNDWAQAESDLAKRVG